MNEILTWLAGFTITIAIVLYGVATIAAVRRREWMVPDLVGGLVVSLTIGALALFGIISNP